MVQVPPEATALAAPTAQVPPATPAGRRKLLALAPVIVKPFNCSGVASGLLTVTVSVATWPICTGP